MVAERAFRRGIAGVDVAFQYDLGPRRHLQVQAHATGQLGLGAAQQAGEGVLRQGVGDRGHGAENGGRIGAQYHRHRERLARTRLLPVAEVQRAAAVRQPAHDHPIAADHLLAVDAEILPLLVRALGDHQPPGDQRAGVARPAGLDRQPAEVHVVALDHLLLTGRIADGLRRHVQHFLEQRQAIPSVLEPFGRLRLLEEGQQLADLAQLGYVLGAHAQRHPPRRAEQIGEHGYAVALGVLEQQRRAAAPQRAVADLGHLQVRADRLANALELAIAL